MMKTLLNLIRRHWLALSLALLAFVTWGSLTPGIVLPQVVHSDKTRHFLAYAAIAFPIGLARPRGWGWMLLALLGWSICIEIIQPFVGRSRDVRDFLANASGAGLGILIATGLRRFAPRAS